MLPEEGLGPPMTPSTCFLASYSCTCPCQPPHLSKGDTDPHRASWLLRQICSSLKHGELYHIPGAHNSFPNTPHPFWDDPGQQNCFVPPWGVVSLDAALGLSKKSSSGTPVFKDIVEDIVQCITRVLQMRIHRGNFSLWRQHHSCTSLKELFLFDSLFTFTSTYCDDKLLLFTLATL